MKIAITIPTGRPRVKNVVRAFLDNAVSHGYNSQDFSVYLSIDTEYQKTQTSEFKLISGLEKKLGNVEYLTSEKRRLIGRKIIQDLDIDPKIIELLYVGRGYSSLRNSALFKAIQDDNDIAICLDDDECPYIPVERKNREITWENLDFFGPHITALSSETDITRGPYIGYLSPIPSDFEKDIPEKIRRKLGEALSPGSDVIDRNTFFNLMSKIKYLPETELYFPSRPFVVQQNRLGKHIYSGNMGINLNSVRQGKVPVFFTPPNARGEDTIFALQLENLNVVEVPSYIFHDPFNLYPEVLEGRFPEILKNIPVTRKSKNRFVEALIGWIKYAPLLIHMTSGDPREREERITIMKGKITEPTQKLAELLNCHKLKDCQKILEEYDNNVFDHYDTLMRSQKAWKKLIIPTYFREKIKI